MSPPKRTVEFWYDFASPDSHPVAQIVDRRAADAQVAVRWRPFRVEPVERRVRERDEPPPPDERGEQEAIYWHNFTRSCDAAGVAGMRPSAGPFDPVPALRAALACEAEGLDPAPFARAVFAARFVQDQDVGDVGRLGELLAEIDYDGGRVLARARDLDIRAQLDANTAEALRQEFIGAPVVITPDGATHWGLEGLRTALWSAFKG